MSKSPENPSSPEEITVTNNLLTCTGKTVPEVTNPDDVIKVKYTGGKPGIDIIRSLTIRFKNFKYLYVSAKVKDEIDQPAVDLRMYLEKNKISWFKSNIL